MHIQLDLMLKFNAFAEGTGHDTDKIMLNF